MNFLEVFKSLEGMRLSLDIANVALRILDATSNALLLDIADMHYKTAMDHFRQAQQSLEPDQENRLAISNLINVCHALDKYSKKMEGGIQSLPPFSLLFWKIQDVVQQTLNVASLISKTYSILGENKNSSYWKNIALREFDRYAKTRPDELTAGCWHYHTVNVGTTPTGISGQPLFIEHDRKVLDIGLYEQEIKQRRASLEELLSTPYSFGWWVRKYWKR